MAPQQLPPQTLSLRASLVGSEPEIWREIEIADGVSLAQLHQVLQIVFGWQQSHLHRFSEQDPWSSRRGIPRIGPEPREWLDQWSLIEQDGDGEDEAEAILADAFSRGGPLWYEYDFGDGWVHRIEMIGSRLAEIGEPLVRLVAGARRGPFEDSGGIGGYAEKLAIMADPRHPEHAEITEWARFVAGPWGSIDPDDADLDGARSELELLTGAPPADMSGLVDSARGVVDDSPIVEFASNLPVPYRTNLRRHLRATGVLDPVELDEAAAAALMRPYLWLLDHIGDGGLTLTQAGWMPPADVAAAVEALELRLVYGKGNREQSTREVAGLRESATQLRLIRKIKGRLELTARVRTIRHDPRAVSAQIAHALLPQRMDDAERIASVVLVLGLADGTFTTSDEARAAVVDIVNGFGYRDQDGRQLDRYWFRPLTRSVQDVLTVVGLWRWVPGGEAPPTDALRAFARMALR
ncbi:plasmid pRiA4b ORF-3 family protein [Microbacterium protaetiae]|uniref:Plasmid pRiA4b ORF-3 family protein n=1 Tax=Microbacterium protaetiae TaxID=2509458 RepID=A0A4P6EEL1_9MICO|nr:plasmid pRiA4b ORF-3 family protein [Microbacterium protaetiae]QAY59519.1 plasmid pRiA4b ORF-3 family protein [Microbacterium protaetiae]